MSSDFPQFSSGHTDYVQTIEFLFYSPSSTPPPDPYQWAVLPPDLESSPFFLLRPAPDIILGFQSKTTHVG